MPSYKTKQVDEAGKAIYKDICNPITKDFRDALYGAILSSFENGREATIGEADGRTEPSIGVIRVGKPKRSVGLCFRAEEQQREQRECQDVSFHE